MVLIQFQSVPKWLILFVILLSLIQTFGSLIIPWLTKDLVDGFAGTSHLLDRHSLYLIITAFLLQGIASAFATYSLSYLAEKVVNQLRKRLWSKVLTLPIPYFDKHRSDDTVSRITNDTAMVKDLIKSISSSIFWDYLHNWRLICSFLFRLVYDFSNVSCYPSCLFNISPTRAHHVQNLKKYSATNR